MRRATTRQRGSAILATSMLVACLCAACGSGSQSPSAVLASFLKAWDGGDTRTLTSLVDHAPDGFAQSLEAVTNGLHASAAQRSAGPLSTKGAQAKASLTSRYDLPGVGPWTVATQISMSRHSGKWLIEWSPAVVAPGLEEGEKLSFIPQWGPRAQILGAAGAALTVDQPQVVVGVEGSRIKDRSALSSLLVASGAPPSAVSAALAAAVAHPTFFEPVVDLSPARYEALGGDTGSLHQAPGTVFRHVTSRAALTPGLGAHLVGQIGPITAQELQEFGPPHTSADNVGQSGLEAYYEKQLAGTPGGRVAVVATNGTAVATLASFPVTPGRPVTTTIDPAVQRAAEQAMSSLTGTAALVAVRVSTGAVVASVGLPSSGAFDAALDGSFPPGSTFKILTSTALFQAGMRPSSPASCPPTVTIDGETFHNAEGDRAASTLADAFVESCNTAFVQLASTHLSSSSFTSVAALYGLGTPLRMGYPAFAGKVPPPPDGAALAATSIGQSDVEASPLLMAAVAGDVARGSVVSPRLVSGAPADSAPTKPLDATLVAELKSMMASVVTTGTAAGTGLPTGTYAKTGTAEYGRGSPLPTDAWLVGWHGDVAFAVVVENSTGNGGPVGGPIIARFLGALPPSDG
jgi:cell division protein FtsI/penicillin-binding protein 2